MIHGWDDAPLARVQLADYPKNVTIVLPFYCNQDFLVVQVMRWMGFSEELRSHLSAIIVDDGSPLVNIGEILRELPRPFPIRLFRIDVDIRWNWLAARNIALHHTHHGWIVATDIDHVIPEETMKNLVWGKHDDQFIYRFGRMEHTGELIHSHPNSWFMTKSMFWKFGGYDEALSGYYGTDGEARRRWVQTAPVFTLHDILVRYECQGDSSTTRYKRKEKIDTDAQRIIKHRQKDWKPLVLSFPYHEISL